MKKVARYRVLYFPKKDAYSIDVEFVGGEKEQVPLATANEFVAALAVLKHDDVSFHEADDKYPGALEAKG